jgi:hypothetical protein
LSFLTLLTESFLLGGYPYLLGGYAAGLFLVGDITNFDGLFYYF